MVDRLANRRPNNHRLFLTTDGVGGGGGRGEVVLFLEADPSPAEELNGACRGSERVKKNNQQTTYISGGALLR